MVDKLISLLVMSVCNSTSDFGVDPKSINAITKGPIVVPNELIPPAKFNLCDPFSTLPKEIANGFAAICCKENPKPTINNAINT